MKNLTKIFMAVAALFAVSCTTDVTEDLGVQLGSGEGQAIISLSLEASRTQLGEKVDGLYPLYWSEGDKISVNGIVSGEAQINASNAANASFAVAASAPYCIAYPAAPAGQVLFADKQTHVSNTSFGNGVSTMYAYSENTVGAQLNHLTGVLKIGVTGSAKLALAQISTIDRAPIAGAFDFDFEKGEIIKASASAKEVIEYSFGEGVQLSNEPTYIHVAVPAGIYNELYVTLYDEDGGVMYAIVKAGTEKPLTVGNVREFSSSIAYAATESVFVVKDKASLLDFASKAATLEKDVLFVNDVDMTGEAWSSIEGYANTVRGNGYAIKGLTAPLFGTTSASIKGLHLTDVNINETTLPIVGAFARQITATNTVTPIIEHCSASGKITVNCTEYEPLEGSHVTINVAGLVGYGLGTSFSDCKNNVEIDVKQLAKSGNTTVATACVGGICSFTYTYKRSDNSVVLTEFTNCENLADINVVEKSHTGEMSVEGSGTFAPLAIWIGGICSSDYSSGGQPNTGAKAVNLVNRGHITASVYSGDCFISGIFANSYTSTRENWVNHGTITLKDSYASRVFLSGLAGCIQSATITKSTNRGVINASNTKCREANVGGVLALNKASITECVNRGPLNICIETAQRTTTYAAAKEYAVGGIIGSSAATKPEIKDCYNYGELNISGTIANNNPTLEIKKETDTGTTVEPDPQTGHFGIGGLIGKSASPVRNCHNEGEINVSVNLVGISATDPSTYNSETADLGIGGLIGSNRINTNNGIVASNKGAINIIEGTFNGPVYVGGLVGLARERFNGNATVGHTLNSGAITICGKGKTTTFNEPLYVAGCSAYVRTNHATDSDNEGTITLNAGVTTAKRSFVGGVFGYVNAISTRCINRGAISLAGTYNDGVLVGGTTSYVTSNYLSLNENYGDITITKDFVNGGSQNTCIGGIIGIFYDSSKALQTSVNNGNITVEAGATSNFQTYIAGICGYAVGSQQTSLTNNGNITIGGTFNNRCGVSGCVAYSKAQVKTGTTGVTNNGNITTTDTSVFNSDAYIAGVTAIASTVTANEVCPLRYATNNGDLSISGDFDFDGNGRLCISGVLGWDAIAGINTLINTGDITINSDFKCTKTTGVKEIAGCVALAQSTVSNSFNTGNITVKRGAQIKDGHIIAGCIADHRSAVSKAHNTGNITIESVAPEGNQSYAAGAIGKTGAGKDVKDVISFCEMKVTGYYYCGFLTGSHRADNVKITNGAIGGAYYTFDSGDFQYFKHDITSDDYKFHIYGSGESTVYPDETYDGIVFLDTKPDILAPAE